MDHCRKLSSNSLSDGLNKTTAASLWSYNQPHYKEPNNNYYTTSYKKPISNSIRNNNSISHGSGSSNGHGAGRAGWVSSVNRTFRRSRSAYSPKHNIIQVLPGPPSSLLQKGDDLSMRNKKRCRVLFSYTPAHDDELELQVDEMIDFMCEVEEGWWKGRLNGRVGVFPSNFVEMTNTDCDTNNTTSNNHSNHSNTVEEKNKKNSLSGASHVPTLLDPANTNRNSVEKEANGSPGSKHLTGSMTASERLLRNTAPPPDTAPRLPPKPDGGGGGGGVASPVQLRRNLSNPTRAVHKSLESGVSPSSIPLSSNLFDPEDEPLGPMFGTISFRFQEEKLSADAAAAAASEAPAAGKKSGGFLARLRHSFGGKARLPKFIGRLSSGNLENPASHVTSPSVKRRNSFASFIKKCSPSANSSKYDLKIERSLNIDDEMGPKRLSQSWEFGQSEGRIPTKIGGVRPLTSTPTSLQGLAATIDFRQRKMRSTENPIACQSWVWQEELKPAVRTRSNPPQSVSCQLSDKVRDVNSCVQGTAGTEDERLTNDVTDHYSDYFSSRNPHVSGDSGIGTTITEKRSSWRGCDSPEEIFGSSSGMNMTDELFHDIFPHKRPLGGCQPISEEKDTWDELERVCCSIDTAPEELPGLARATARNHGGPDTPQTKIRTGVRASFPLLQLNSGGASRRRWDGGGRAGSLSVAAASACDDIDLSGLCEGWTGRRGRRGTEGGLSRNPIATNPFVSWKPPEGVKKMESVEVTEI